MFEFEYLLIALAERFRGTVCCCTTLSPIQRGPCVFLYNVWMTHAKRFIKIRILIFPSKMSICGGIDIRGGCRSTQGTQKGPLYDYGSNNIP